MKIHQTILLCLSFFTRLPLSRWAPSMDSVPLAKIVWAFPIAGALIGLASGVTYWLFYRLGFTPGLAAILMIAFQLWLTGALHEDGLADTADGFAGGYNKESRLRIMRDSSIGSFGALALIVTMLLRIYALTLLSDPKMIFLVVISADSISRAMIAVGMYVLPSARPDGLAVWAGKPALDQMSISVSLASCIILILLKMSGVMLIIAALCTCGIMCLVSRRKIGGITGDVYGAIQQVTETSLLIIATLFIHV